jgi:membrane protein
MAVAGGVVFYSLLSLFPAIAAGVSSYALFFNPESITKQVAFAAGVVPSNALTCFATRSCAFANKSDGKLTLGFAIGFAIASANAV